ncbi:MAG TPA: gfo/Idh/MocA family oxidoreductase [Planctomycetaceae bacterium]|nr:gfo/Idh/MocA family oxidoreductase [Planctomycetaceae bacterium]
MTNPAKRESQSVQSATTTVSRRTFAGGLAAATALPAIVPASALGRGRVAPSERITMGIVGVGPRCRYDLGAMLKEKDVEFVALADVQKSRRDEGKKLIDDHYGNDKLQTYRDFREVLDRKDIDGMLIATGDRWHAAASIMAAEAGKDVYSEKPCGITIADCQRLSETMHRTGRVFQAGTQRRSVPNFGTAVKMAHDGTLGDLHTLHASVYKPTLDNSWLPAEKTPPQDVVDWNMWLGPAAWRPFNQKYVDGRWRGQWDFDSGARLLDWGAHTVDLCQWANQADETMPVEYTPGANEIVCKYANGVKLVIDFLPDPFGDRSPHYVTRLGTCPVRFHGERGSVETGDSGEIVASNAELQNKLPANQKRVRGLDVSAHGRNFFDCIKSREQPNAGPDVMRRSHVACHAAAIAWILGRTVRINPQTEEFVDDAEATLLRSRPERPWQAT